MKWFSVAEIADQLGVSRATVAGLCRDGLLEAVTIARKDAIVSCLEPKLACEARPPNPACNNQSPAVSSAAHRNGPDGTVHIGNL